jgi:hypothetical protein
VECLDARSPNKVPEGVYGSEPGPTVTGGEADSPKWLSSSKCKVVGSVSDVQASQKLQLQDR